MRISRIALSTCITLLMGGVAIGQRGAVLDENNKPPTDSVRIFTFADLQARIKGDQPARILDGMELFSLNLLHRKVEPPVVHAEVVDLYIVQEGAGTLESGGTLLNPKPSSSRAGDQTGTAISGGTTQVIKKGDVVFIPPGVAHRFSGGDIWYLNVHFPGKNK